MMKNLLNFFFSFDKLFKEKLVVPFFWLAIIVWGLGYSSYFLEKISLSPIASVFTFFQTLISILFALVVIRIISELIVAIFRINDNLSPDGGKSELADIDPMAEARKAAEQAAARTREATKSVRENVGEMSETVQGKAKAATASVREKADGLKPKTGTEKAKAEAETTIETPKRRGRPKGSKNKPKTETSTPASAPSAPKKRGRPPGSKNKKPSAKTAAAKTPGKRGPKPGTKIPRDADGNLLKKDGTPRKKPGPKT